MAMVAFARPSAEHAIDPQLEEAISRFALLESRMVAQAKGRPPLQMSECKFSEADLVRLWDVYKSKGLAIHQVEKLR
eukprot:11210542-Lingulodinium_polyedra.AAC.1